MRTGNLWVRGSGGMHVCGHAPADVESFQRHRLTPGVGVFSPREPGSQAFPEAG